MVVLLAGVFAGAMLERCDGRGVGCGAGEVRDTVVVVDTVRVVAPVASGERLTGGVIRARVRPRAAVTGEPEAPARATDGFATGAGQQRLREDEGAILAAEPGRQWLREDEGEVELAVMQREYEGEEYHAWVSGYEPRLDSIYVFPRREVVTIREAPIRQGRWGIGPSVGLGYTAGGWRPFVGVSLTYTMISF